MFSASNQSPFDYKVNSIGTLGKEITINNYAHKGIDSSIQ